MSQNCSDCRAVGIVLLLLLLTPTLSAAVAGNSPPPRWIAALISDLEKKTAESEAKIRRSDEILVNSRRVLAKAQRLNDAKAESIARQAIDITEATKSESVRSLKRTRITLNTLKRLSETWGNQPGRSAAVYCTGKVEVQRPGETGWNSLGEGNKIGSIIFQPGDHIRTGDDSRADIRLLDDGSSINVGKNSTVEIEAPNRLFVTAGIVVAAIKSRVAARFEVRTPSAVAAVRGTQFLVGVSQSGETEVTVTEGSVEVTNSTGTDMILVEAGHTASVAKDGHISKPNGIDQKTIDRWWED